MPASSADFGGVQGSQKEGVRLRELPVKQEIEPSGLLARRKISD